MLPYKLTIDGGATIVSALQRAGLVAGTSVTKGGQVSINIWNSHREPIYLTPKTVLVNIFGAKVYIKEFGKGLKTVLPRSLMAGSLSSRDIQKEITRKFPKVGDLSSHPINRKMRCLEVRRDEVSMREPTEWGIRTQYAIENVADRRLVQEQLEAYVKRGYLREVSASEKVYLSPLLPIRKPNGTFRFTNDLRKLNSYFSSVGTSQVDVWRKLWEIDSSWRYFMEIDLKDGFFNLPIDRDLSKLFGFTFGQKRYAWIRLPQGWKWSSPIFCERIAEILKGIPGGIPQYCDNVLIGAKTPEELMEKALQVFKRFNEYGLKVNFEKVKWMTTKLSFLGWEIEGGEMSLKGYLQKKQEQLGPIRTVNDLERVIGIISYARRVIQSTEEILAPLREDLKILKHGKISESWFRELDEHVAEAFRRVHTNTKQLCVPGVQPIEFRLETDWSKGHAGYMLFAILASGRECLVDIGSTATVQGGSSYLGELSAIVWACKQTKAYRGSIPLTICSDNHGLFDKERKQILIDNDYRTFRRWGWLLANEPGFTLIFRPGDENRGADLLSRKGKKIKAIGDKSLAYQRNMWSPGKGEYFVQTGKDLSSYGALCNAGRQYIPESVMRDLVRQEHLRGHLGAWKVYKALRRQGYQIPMTFVRKELIRCETCARFREEYPRDKWHAIQYSDKPGAVVYVDFIGPLPPAPGGIRYIQCIVDSATNLASATSHRTPNGESAVEGVKVWQRRNGPIGVLISDSSGCYISNIFKQWCAANRVQHKTIAPYRHQSLGLVERFHRSLQDRLKKITFHEGGNWKQHLNRAVNILNQSVHSSTDYTPLELWNGTPEMRRKALQKRDAVRSKINEKLLRLFPYQFRPGQRVLVRDYWTLKTNKFAPTWRGPYILRQKVSDTMWRAENPSPIMGSGRRPSLLFHQDQIQAFPE